MAMVLNLLGAAALAAEPGPSESSDLPHSAQANPEVQSIATGAKWICTSACRKGPEGSQVGGFPERDAVADDVSKKHSLPIKRARERTIQVVAGQGLQNRS